MRGFWVLLIAVAALAGCQSAVPSNGEGEADVVLTVEWQRLVTEEGETCDRCGGTQEELDKALEVLRASLSSLGIEVALEQSALTTEECAADIMQSNRIVIGGRALEEWVSGEVGQSICGSCCGAIGEEVECRTVTVDGNTYEVIPAELIVRAGLMAASELMRIPSESSCCPNEPGPCGAETPCSPGQECDEEAT